MYGLTAHHHSKVSAWCKQCLSGLGTRLSTLSNFDHMNCLSVQILRKANLAKFIEVCSKANLHWPGKHENATRLVE